MLSPSSSAVIVGAGGAGGNGGSANGGAIYVATGGTLTLLDTPISGTSVTGGAAVMALFALGSGLTLWLGPWLLLRLGRSGRGAWGMRLAGLARAATSAWGLWMGLVHDQAPWCLVPA